MSYELHFDMRLWLGLRLRLSTDSTDSTSDWLVHIILYQHLLDDLPDRSNITKLSSSKSRSVHQPSLIPIQFPSSHQTNQSQPLWRHFLTWPRLKVMHWTSIKTLKILVFVQKKKKLAPAPSDWSQILWNIEFQVIKLHICLCSSNFTRAEWDICAILHLHTAEETSNCQNDSG